jgi:hypothetical protein
VATLSYAADLGLGQPMAHCMRQTVIALRLGGLAGASDPELEATYYLGLMMNVYCHADAAEQARWFGDDFVRDLALPFVVIKEPAERDASDHHVGVLGPVVELRPLSRPAKEEDLEPAVLGPSKVRDDASHGHQRRGRKECPAGIRVGQSLAFPANERALQVEPADQLGPLIGHERRTIAGQRHERRRYRGRHHLASHFSGG